MSNNPRVAKTTLHEYLDYLQDAFLLQAIHIYTQSERKRMVNPIKPYAIDTGLAAAFSMMREPEISHLLENCIFVELCRRNAQVTYLVTESGHEVDFVAEYPDGTIEVIQVSTDLSDPLTRQREYRSLSDLGSALPKVSCLLLNLSDEDTVGLGDLTVSIMPAWKWLLGN
jgi:predicted AAA+ superfamily ATPase